MNKLSLDALKERAEAVATEDLLLTISGGTENSCHDSHVEERPEVARDATWTRTIHPKLPPKQ